MLAEHNIHAAFAGSSEAARQAPNVRKALGADRWRAIGLINERLDAECAQLEAADAGPFMRRDTKPVGEVLTGETCEQTRQPSWAELHEHNHPEWGRPTQASTNAPVLLTRVSPCRSAAADRSSPQPSRQVMPDVRSSGGWPLGPYARDGPVQ